MKHLVILAQFVLSFVLAQCVMSGAAYTKSNTGETNVYPGIPIAIFYDKHSSPKIQELVDRAVKSINSGIQYGRNKWGFQAHLVEIEDSYQLVQSICHQMSRGALAIFGPKKWSTINFLTSFTNFYNIPYITWSFLDNISSDSNNNETLAASERLERLLSEELLRRERLDSDDDQVEEELLVHTTTVNEPGVPPAETQPAGAHEAAATLDSQIYLRPDIVPALIELVKFHEWTTIYYVYNHEYGLVNLESLFDHQNRVPGFLDKLLIRKVDDIHNCRDMLRAIEASNERSASSSPLSLHISPTSSAASLHSSASSNNHGSIVMVVDLYSKENYASFLNQIKELGMTKSRYNYVLATYGVHELDVNDFRHGGASIFGFSLVDYHNVNTVKLLSEILPSSEPINNIPNIPNDAALIIDGLAYFVKRINALVGLNMSRLFGMENVSLRRGEIYVNKSKGINCSYEMRNTNRWPMGRLIVEQLRSEYGEAYEGLTGAMRFDSHGKRVNYKISVYKVELNKPLMKVGNYTPGAGLVLDHARADQHRDESRQIKIKRRLVVVSIADEPFFMVRDDALNHTGNDRFVGYCVDLTKRLSEMLNFTYELSLVKDNKFGSRDASGNWNGMVGELVRHEADIAVAPLTITSQRERAIEFSMPFMNMGISIMIKKPKKEKPGVFSFMEPLDVKVWYCVALALIGVSLILFLVSRFSPYEWYYDASKNPNGLHNDFTIFNTFWFNIAAIMQQGVDFAPRSLSGRLVAGVWWFFTLILISSYTANLAAFLTVERMVSPIESAEQLSRQTEIQYGAVEAGSTKEFFKNSKVDVYMRMWSFMLGWGPNIFVKNNEEGVQRVRESKGKYAFLLESSLNEYLNERYPCDTIKVGNDLDSKGYGVATPIRSELKDPINLAILQLREEGFLEELKTKWWYDRSECGNAGSTAKDSSQSALNLINVAGIFYILIVILISSVLVTSFELFYKARVQAKKNRILFSDAIKSKMRFSIAGYEDNNFKINSPEN